MHVGSGVVTVQVYLGQGTPIELPLQHWSGNSHLAASLAVGDDFTRASFLSRARYQGAREVGVATRVHSLGESTAVGGYDFTTKLFDGLDDFGGSPSLPSPR